MLFVGRAQIVEIESRKIDEARGGGASAHPTDPICSHSNLHAARNEWRINSSTGEHSTVQCSAVQIFMFSQE